MSNLPPVEPRLAVEAPPQDAICEPMNGKDVRAEHVSPMAVAEQQAAEVAAQEEPCFEIRIMSRLTGTTEPLHHIKIWADGHIEGLGKLADRNPVLVENRIPMLLEQMMQPLAEYLHDVGEAIDKLAAPQKAGG